MPIPLDNLYHWIESLLPDPAVLYVFRPPGSKKISNCDLFKAHDDYNRLFKFPGIIAHDQEPLDWNFYNFPEQYLDIDRWKEWNHLSNDQSRLEYCANFNLKSLVFAQSGLLYDQVILIHSEKNSVDLEHYRNNEFLCVHYWAHAVIAQDWYRFAEHDIRLNTSTKPKNKFLIYCRDWSHRREYRLKFLELLVQNNLDKVSQTSVMHTNSKGVNFLQYRFENPEFQLINPESIGQIPNNTFSSTSSADYNHCDFTDTEISVILETVFDGSRIHLTEKTLRPIACEHPFVLAAGPGSLEYIKSYGFKTFAPWIDESYDLEINSLKRMEKIIASMKQIQDLQGQKLVEFSQAVKQIAPFNKKHFFSDKFFNTVRSELKNNLHQAYSKVKHTRGKHYLERLKLLKKLNLEHQIFLRQEKTLFLRQLRQSYQRDRSNPAADLFV